MLNNLNLLNILTILNQTTLNLKRAWAGNELRVHDQSQPLFSKQSVKKLKKQKTSSARLKKISR